MRTPLFPKCEGRIRASRQVHPPLSSQQRKRGILRMFTVYWAEWPAASNDYTPCHLAGSGLIATDWMGRPRQMVIARVYAEIVDGLSDTPRRRKAACRGIRSASSECPAASDQVLPEPAENRK